jgi:hypothetical protein
MVRRAGEQSRPALRVVRIFTLSKQETASPGHRRCRYPARIVSVMKQLTRIAIWTGLAVLAILAVAAATGAAYQAISSVRDRVQDRRTGAGAPDWGGSNIAGILDSSALDVPP